MSLVEILRGCNITFEDEIHDEVDGGMVIIQGEPGTGTVTLSSPHRFRRKMVRFDQLTRATWFRIGETWRITGKSHYLQSVILSPDVDLTIDVTPTNCKDCNK